MNKVTPSLPISIVPSLLTPEQLEQQLEHTKNRLAEFMERSTISRKRLNDHVEFNYQDYRPSISLNPPSQHQVFYSSCHLSTSARTHNFNDSNSIAIPSTALSHSRAQFASFVNNNMNIASPKLKKKDHDILPTTFYSLTAVHRSRRQ
jgi:hypothetical protein